MPEVIGPARLESAAAALGVALDPDQVAALVAFAELLLRWNRTFNLISRRDVERLLPRHLLDSLSVAPLLRGGRVMDLGTGAGLPGVPLAIARKDLAFTLVDRSGRKIRFVDRAVRELGLGNVETRCADVRELPGDLRFDTVVSRAVADLATAWALAAPRLETGGRLVVMHRVQGEEDATVIAPPSSRVLDRRSVHIAGLERPHDIVVLGAADDRCDALPGDDNARDGP
ncbi:MAG: 16S rRNA (guanine(527)-N(7))-methyltransferase RsmG [Pseudomonadales bacterium]